jgi:hypothetical protein
MSSSTIDNPNKRVGVIRELRRRIVVGELAPGSQLPSRGEILRDFGVSSVTATKAIEQLKDEGFVYGRKGSGIFVVDHPPHLVNYALAFPTPVNDPVCWTRFTAALRQEAGRLEVSKPCKIVFRYGVDEPQSNPERRALEHEVIRHRVAGVILTRNPFHLEASPILTEPGMPRVMLASQPWRDTPGVWPDFADFSAKAVDHLLAQGRRRIAVLALATADPTVVQLQQAMAARNLETKPYWIQRAAHSSQHAVRDQVHLLMQVAKNDGVDGLIITDDNLIEGAVAGLLASGVSVPNALSVVAHANFPWLAPSPLPLHYIGFDAGEILTACTNVIDMQRQGHTPARMTLVPAIERNPSEVN